MPQLSTPNGPPERQLANYDVRALAGHIVEATRCPLPRAQRAAAKVFHHAFAADHRGDARWDDEALAAAGVGRWVRAAALELSPRIGLTVAERARSEDGSERLLLVAADGASFESVIIPAEAGRDRARTTLCLSSQVGCARGCAFCETAALGLERQLTAGEMVDQYRIARRLCEPDAPGRPGDARVARDAAPVPLAAEGDGPRRGRHDRAISNIVFMGMGEPLDNLTALTCAMNLLTTQQAFAVPPSRITVSTAGVANQLARFFRDTRAELAISLNAPDDARRSELMPINRRFDLATLRAALVATMPPGRRVLFQYALFAGFNDAPEDADALAAYLGDIPARVNIIPANPGPRLALRTPGAVDVEAFARRLQSHGVTTLVRQPRGRDVGGACGQLAGARRRRADQEPSPCPSP